MCVSHLRVKVSIHALQEPHRSLKGAAEGQSCWKTPIQPSCELRFKPQGPAASSSCLLSRTGPGCTEEGDEDHTMYGSSPIAAALCHPSDLFLPKDGNQSPDTLLLPYPPREPSTSARKVPAGTCPEAVHGQEGCTSLLPNSSHRAALLPKIRLPNTSAPVTRCRL